MKWSEYEMNFVTSEDAQSVVSYQTLQSKLILPEYSDSKPLNRESYISTGIARTPTHFPSDDEILAEVKHILSTTDLMKVTKKNVRDQLSRLYGVDMLPKKDYIHYCIDGILRGDL